MFTLSSWWRTPGSSDSKKGHELRAINVYGNQTTQAISTGCYHRLWWNLANLHASIICSPNLRYSSYQHFYYISHYILIALLIFLSMGGGHGGGMKPSKDASDLLDVQLIQPGYFSDCWEIVRLRLDIPEGKFSSTLFAHLHRWDLFQLPTTVFVPRKTKTGKKKHPF